jgi:hypothetical protein
VTAPRRVERDFFSSLHLYNLSFPKVETTGSAAKNGSQMCHGMLICLVLGNAECDHPPMRAFCRTLGNKIILFVWEFPDFSTKSVLGTPLVPGKQEQVVSYPISEYPGNRRACGSCWSSQAGRT